MAKRKDIRRLAMQLLYQMDVTRNSDAESIAQSLDDEYDSAAVRAEAVALAQSAWRHHDQADLIVANLAPAWPTHRQPPVDRSILRLAYFEMVTKRTVVKVAINEAVELAKAYGAKESSAFINGVLDKMAKQIVQQEQRSREAAAVESEGQATVPTG